MNQPSKFRILPALALLLIIGSSCVEMDRSLSLYVTNEGQIDAILLLDRVRSESIEPDRTKEQKKWLKEFKDGSLDTLKELRTIKARHIKSHLLRSEPPYSGVIRASLDSVDTLAKWWSINTQPGGDTVRFVKEGRVRKIVFQIAGKAAQPSPTPSTSGPSASNPQTYPLIKFIPTAGKITETTGCMRHKDENACTLDLNWIDQMEQAGKGYSIIVTWEIPPGK